MNIDGLQLSLLIIFAFSAAASVVLYRAWKIIEQQGGSTTDAVTESKLLLKQCRNTVVFLSILTFIIFCSYQYVVQHRWESHVLEWLNLLIRWAHVVFGIAWIGASFYFIFLENSLNRSDNIRDELAGNLWAIHGGGFYYVEKFKSAPVELPKNLHWFKYEAYFTWLTGMLLLTLVYFMNADAVMLDSAVSSIDSTTAVVIGLVTTIGGWFIYDMLCKSALLDKKKQFAITGFIIVTIISVLLSITLSGRAAFMLIGSLLGTIMAGNVFFCIIPSQKALVAAAKANNPVDAELGRIAGLRSLHNNYITLPVIFIMISNHFPTTFGNTFNWIVLSLLILASVAVRHFINMYEKGINTRWMLPFAAITIIALVVVTAPKPIDSYDNATPVSFLQVQPIIQQRCANCHSSHPTDDINKVPPNGIMFDTPEQIVKHADRIMVRAVQTKTMPQANKTGMSDEERNLIGSWIMQGAKVR